jgi:hypothetical protein
MRRQPAEHAHVNVVIMARDVGKAVVKRVVLARPDVRAASYKVERHGHHFVDPSAIRVPVVPAVVHNAEPDAGHR